jgi:hypothetical protein
MLVLGGLHAEGTIAQEDDPVRKFVRKFLLLLFEHSFLASKETQPVTITKINWLMAFKEIIAV